MRDLNARIKQLTNLILTSQTVDENRGDESRPTSPSKIDFDMTPYQVRGRPLVLLGSEADTATNSSSNKSSLPRDARSNRKRRKFLRSRRRSSRGPSCRLTHQKTRRIACWENRHAISASSRWSSRGTRTTSAHRCVRCVKTSNGNGAGGWPRKRRSARRRRNGRRSSHMHSRGRKRSVGAHFIRISNLRLN